MHTATASLKSVAPYSQSRHYFVEKTDRETPDEFEKRTWRERCHVNTDGTLHIPGMAFKNCIGEAAKFISMQVPGKGKSTYTKHFDAGVLVLENLNLPETKDTVEGEWLFLNADGVRGSGRRVMKCYPVIKEWNGLVTFTIFDNAITEPVFRKHLEEAGKFIGIGRFRPRNRGVYGRFEVVNVQWA